MAALQEAQRRQSARRHVLRLSAHGLHRRTAGRLGLEELEDRILLNGGTLPTPIPLVFDPFGSAHASGLLAGPSQMDLYQVSLADDKQLSAAVHVPASGNTLVPRLTLYGPDETTELAQSDGAVPGDPAAALDQDLLPGTYYLAVTSQAGKGNYQLQTELAPATLPLQQLPVGTRPYSVAAADVNGDGVDVNGDGVQDLVVANDGTPSQPGTTVSVLLGNRDGSFQPQRTFSIQQIPQDGNYGPGSVAVADLNGDGKLDLVTANYSGSVSVLFGNGDGSFGGTKDPTTGLYSGGARTFAVGAHPTNGDPSTTLFAVAVADFNGDGIPDLVVTDFTLNKVRVLLGQGDGTFGAEYAYDVGAGPFSLTVADVNRDHRPDILVGNELDGTVSVLRNTTTQPSALSFQSQGPFKVGSYPSSVAVADVNGDRKPDLVVANHGPPGNPANTLSVLLGNGDGTFGPQQTFEIGQEPFAVAVADLNGDGRPDLVSANYADGTVSVLLNDTTPGASVPTFQKQRTFIAGTFPTALAIHDLNGDGRPDLVVTDGGTQANPGSTLRILWGNGDGTFRPQDSFVANSGPLAVAVGDVNGDGRPDLVVANYGSRSAKDHGSTVSVLSGNGDGSFAPPQSFPAEYTPASIALADLNGDGRRDAVVVNKLTKMVSVLLGNGDGSFRPPQTYSVGQGPLFVTVADLNGDGHPDLVVANGSDSTISVLLGNGDGTFQPQQTFAVGQGPDAVVVADVNGDGKPDLIVANSLDPGTQLGDNTVGVLLGNGNGTFQREKNFDVGSNPTSVALADVNGDGIQDLVVANYGTPTAPGTTVSVLLGNGKGSFGSQQAFPVGQGPLAVAAADVNGDGLPDLIVTNAGYGNNIGSTVSVLLNATKKPSALGFHSQSVINVGQNPRSVIVQDLNGDGRPDLAIANNDSGTVSVLLGQGDGSFLPATPATGVGLRNTPRPADFDQDGIPDVVTLDSSGRILFRHGLPGPAGTFGSPMVINPEVDPKTGQLLHPARDLALLHTPAGLALAAADLGRDAVSIYPFSNGSFGPPTDFPTSRLPVRLAVADLNGDHWDDLVVANELDNNVTIAFQDPKGQFKQFLTLPVGTAPSAIAFADVNGDGRTDILVSNQASGDVTVLLNDASHSFATSYRFRAGTGLYGLDTSASSLAVTSDVQPVSLAVGNFTGAGLSDLAVVDRGGHRIQVLRADGQGGFVNPQPALATSTSDFDPQGEPLINDQPGPVVTDDFNGDGKPDLAVLMEDRGEVWIYLGKGDGTFTHSQGPGFSIPVGGQATGLSLAPGTGKGPDDLLVGNQFGDVLRLVGNADGSFQPPPPLTGNHVSVSALSDLLGPGRPGALVANQQTNHVTVQAPAPGGQLFTQEVQTLAAEQPATQLSPADGQLVPLEKNSPFPDAVVLGSGSNDVLVFRGTGTGQFDRLPQTFSVGQNPVGLTVADLNGDGIPDLLVANQGSNDVSVLFGSYDANGNWTATSGPRLNSGGSGPMSTLLEDVTGPQGKPDGIPDLVVTNAGSNTVTMLPGVGQGFFNDQDPQQLLSLSGSDGPLLSPVTRSGGVPLVPTTREIISLPAPGGAAANTVFVAPPGEVIAAVGAGPSDGELVVAFRGGKVEMLAFNGASQEYVPVADLVSVTGLVPTDPSALTVLDTASGFEVLVTNAGSDQVFVFEFEAPPTETTSTETSSEQPEAPPTVLAAFEPPLPSPELPASPTQSPPGESVSEATAPPEAPLTLVATLLSGNLTEGQEAPSESSGTAVSSVGGAEEGLTATSGTSTQGSGDDEGPEGGDSAVVRTDETADPALDADVDEALRLLDLYRLTEDPQRDGPVTKEGPEEQDSWAGLLADLWQEPDQVPAGSHSFELAQWLSPDALGPASAATVPQAVSPRPAANAADLAGLDVLDWTEAAVTDRPQGPAAGRPEVAPALPKETVAPPAANADIQVGLLEDRRWDVYRACVTALAVGGLAWWSGESRLEASVSAAQEPAREGDRPVSS